MFDELYSDSNWQCVDPDFIDQFEADLYAIFRENNPLEADDDDDYPDS